MRRIFRDSTAIALSLSLGLPAVASAQVLPATDAARIGAERAANMPELAQMLEKERGAGLNADALTCLMNAPKPCTENTPLFTPQGIAVQLGDDGGFILAPAAQQIKRVDGTGQLVPVENDKTYSAPRAEAAPAAPVVMADAGAAAASATGEAAIIPPGKAAEKAVEAAAKDAEKAAAEADKAAEKAAKDAEKAVEQAAKDAEKAAKEAEKAASDAKKEAEKETASTDAANVDTASVDTARAAVEAAAKGGQGAVVVTTPSAADKGDAAKPKDAAASSADAAKSEADLARALAEREAASASTAPAGKDPVVIPAAPAEAPVVAQGAPVVAPSAPSAAPAPAAATVSAAEQDALAEALAAAKATPEATAKETDAAREAAAATEAPAVAALVESSAPVETSEKTTVTEANSRAATEDFATDLSGQAREAVAAATAAAGTGNQPTPATKDSGDSDLEKVLKQAILPALAGMAVGSMLSNNREVALNTGDRVIVTRTDGSQEIIKDDNALLFRPGSTVQTENYTDGSSRTVVARADGSQVITIRDADLRVLRRTVVHPDGTTTALIDETAAVQPVDVAALPKPAEPVVVMPGQAISDEALREALRRETAVDRSFTLGQIRNIPEVRALVAPVDIQAITFDTGSAAIKADQAQALSTLGRVIVEQIRQNPREMFLIEGHTDTVGADAMNLALSDRRAESVALALTEFFQVPPENMVVQGYGEQFLKIAREGDVRANRRAAVRRITDLLARN